MIRIKFATIVSLFIIFGISSCKSRQLPNGKTKYHTTVMEFDKSAVDNSVQDSIEYEIIIDDPGFESFLASQRPMDFYTQKYYENWNVYYVNDWNQKINSASFRDNNCDGIFETYINYDQSLNYGLEVNYKLFYYFRFVEYKYRIKFAVPKAISY